MRKSKKVIASGRKATDEFFEQGLEGGVSYPFLILSQEGHTVEVVQTTKVTEVLSYPDETMVMKQWPGKWRSDFFQFSVGEMREFRESQKAEDVSFLPLIESVNARVNRLGRVENVEIVYLDHKYHSDRPMCFYNSVKAMEFMEEALSFNPKMVKVTKNSHNTAKFPDEEFDGESWLKSHEVFVGKGERNSHRSWSKIMSEKEKRQLGLLPLISDINHRIRLPDGQYFSGTFGKDGLPKIASDAQSFWRCTRQETAERWLNKIKYSGDQREWFIEDFLRKV